MTEPSHEGKTKLYVTSDSILLVTVLARRQAMDSMLISTEDGTKGGHRDLDSLSKYTS